MEKIRMKKLNYIQNEYKNIYGCESPWTDQTTLSIVKLHYLGELLKLECEGIRKNVSTKS